jgi:HAMP domain-containing protein
MIYWVVGFVVAAVVVVIVAALLLGIIWQCQRIIRLARTAHEVVQQIDSNTRCIWSLGETGAVAGRLLGVATSIERNAGSIVRAVNHETDERAA